MSLIVFAGKNLADKLIRSSACRVNQNLVTESGVGSPMGQLDAPTRPLLRDLLSLRAPWNCSDACGIQPAK